MAEKPPGGEPQSEQPGRRGRFQPPQREKRRNAKRRAEFERQHGSDFGDEGRADVVRACFPEDYQAPATNAEVEPNNSTATANSFNTSSDAIMNGDITPAGDQDFYRFTVGQRQEVYFDTYAMGNPSGCPGDTLLRLRDSGGNQIGFNDDAGGDGCELPFDDPGPGDLLHLRRGVREQRDRDRLLARDRLRRFVATSRRRFNGARAG